VLARAGDGAILVVRHGRTTKEQLARTVATLQAVDARLLGTVLNRVPRKGPDASYYGYAYSSYDQRPADSTVVQSASASLQPRDLAASHVGHEAARHASRHQLDWGADREEA
jgi:hypothetical protein